AASESNTYAGVWNNLTDFWTGNAADQTNDQIQIKKQLEALGTPVAQVGSTEKQILNAYHHHQESAADTAKRSADFKTLYDAGYIKTSSDFLTFINNWDIANKATSGIANASTQQ